MPLALPDSLPPVPPDELMSRVGPHFTLEQAQQAREDWWRIGAERQAERLKIIRRKFRRRFEAHEGASA